MNTLSLVEQMAGWIWQTTWQAAVLAIIILLTQYFLRNRLSPAWRHGLWFLLVARLLMPVTPSSAVSIFNVAKWLPRRAPVAEAMTAVPAPPSADAVVPQSPKRELNLATGQKIETAAVAQPLRPSSFQSGPVTVIQSTSPGRMDGSAIMSFFWLAGVLFLGVRFIWLNRRFARRLANESPMVDNSIDLLFYPCAQAIGVSQKVRLIETNAVDSPAVFGVFGKRLLLPRGMRDELSVGELRHILLHELAHLKRRDPELNGLLAALQILHWFNPVLWLAFARIRSDRELATDDLALACAGHSERLAYGDTIVKVLEGMTQPRLSPGLVGIAESKANLKERIRSIARSGRPRWRAGALAVAVLIAIFALTGASENNSKPINLLERYPTRMTAGDAEPSRARPWQFTQSDLFQVSHFNLETGTNLRVECGLSDLGIGHCQDGAVWAVLIPRQTGKLLSSAAAGEEKVATVWLRFHPSKIAAIFPPDTVSPAGGSDGEERIRAIAEAKMDSSWQAGGNAMIPEPKDMTVDLGTQGGPRRFFIVDLLAQTAEYAPFFADKSAEASAPPVSAPDARCARVVFVSPADGATGVEPAQDLRIRFDRAMDPHHLKLQWLTGGFQLNGSIQVSADQTEFIIPVRLTPGQKQTLAVNNDMERERMRLSGEKKPPVSLAPTAGADFMDATSVAANEFQWSFLTRPVTVAKGAAKPKVVNISPPSGPAPKLTLVQITFDQPMQPPDELLPYAQKKAYMDGPSLVPSIDYDSARRRFTLPALLPADNDARLTLQGFYGANGAACDPIVVHSQTDTQTYDPKYKAKAAASAKDPALIQLFTSMKEARARLNSGIETVQTLSLRLDKNAYNNIEGQTATFKWQGSDQAYGDISGPMEMGTFLLGCDGQNCWVYSEDETGGKRLDRTPAAVTQREVIMADPFGLARRTVAKALASQPFVLESSADLDGHSCCRVEVWNRSNGGMGFATKTQWWIDQETFLPKQYVQYRPFGCDIVRFDYSHTSEPLPDSAFQPPPTTRGEIHTVLFKKGPAPGEHRFLIICDGSNGSMSGRIGWNDSNGQTDSGMN